MKFYHTFTVNYDNFSKKGKVFLLGDSNARLGEFLNDLDFHGNTVSNKNKPLFQGFLDYSGLTLLNRKYCFGIPTYEVINRKRSIIDFGLTNSDNLVENFEIMPNNIGVSPQSCHKVLKLSLKFNFKEPVIICPDRVNFNLLGSKESYYFLYILARFEELEYSHLLVNYNLVQNIYIDAKKIILGKFTSKAKKRKQSPE